MRAFMSLCTRSTLVLQVCVRVCKSKRANQRARGCGLTDGCKTQSVYACVCVQRCNVASNVSIAVRELYPI